VITHNLIQSTPAWHAHRATHFNASDSPAMMGCSPHKTRSQLLHARHTGLTPEVDPTTQRRFDDGHRFEALARPLAEAIIGEDLYPVTGSSGKLSASFDGLTMDESTAFEHKTLNAELRALMVDDCLGSELPLQYRVQMEHQCMVSGSSRALFMASKWDGDKLVEVRHCWYTPDADLLAAIGAGWNQFEADLAAYVPPEAAAPAPTGRAPETLPALLITVKGEVTASNLAEFKETALTAIRSVNRELCTDQHFADAEKAVKWCDDIEKRVAGAKQHALSQTATIDQLFKAMDDISAEARQVRLDLSKLVAARKVSLKTELLTEAQTALREHVAALNTRLGRAYMPAFTADFAAAIHGKKNFDSMRAALNAALANAKIDANATADRIQANLTTLRELAGAHTFLFSDASTIVLKACDDLTALVKTRIAEHAATELAKEAATRERIRVEEQAKAEAAARATLAAEQTAIADLERAAQNLAAKKFADSAAAELAAAKPAQQNAPQIIQAIIQAAPAIEYIAVPAIQTIAPAPNVVSIVRPPAVAAIAPVTPPSMKLGDINAHLSPITLTADGLEALGFPVAAMVKGAKLYHASDLTRICGALHDLIDRVQAKQAA